MKVILSILLLAATSIAFSQELPSGISTKSFDCTYTVGQSSNYYYKDEEMIGKVEPGSCFYSETEGGRVNPLCYAEFYKTSVRDTFGTKKEATNWIIAQMNEYFQPVVLTKWKSLKVQPPKVTLRYPWDWNYRLDKMDGIFKSESLSENKVTLVIDDQNGHSEIMWIIRTPNTAKLTTAQVMELTANMNGAINFKTSPPSIYIIGEKTFQTSQNTFMQQMNQQHYWCADEQEIIYISCNLLKDERLRYPDVINIILQSIRW